MNDSRRWRRSTLATLAVGLLIHAELAVGAGSRPSSAPSPGDARSTATAKKHPTTATGKRPSTAAGKRPSTAAGKRPASGAQQGDKRNASHASATLPRIASGGETHERKIVGLREQLESILREPPLSRARVGLVAMQLSDGDVLFSHNADQRFNPASNTKMLTTAAAIARLGGDFRYLTALYGPPADLEGVVSGDVVLRGSSDPSLTANDLAELARGLAERGITRLRGDLIVDRRPIGYDGASTDGLIFNRNSLAVRVRPTEPKHAPAVSLEPPSTGITIENSATTVTGRRTRLSLDTYRKDDHLVVTVRGRIAVSRGTVVIGKRVADGALLGGHTLAGLLPDFGITLEGRVRSSAATSPTVDPGVALAVHRSASLADVSRISNKPSNNFVADAIYKTLGGELFGLPGTLEKGTRAVSDWLVEHGVARDRFHLVNGSGLTHENRVTPGDLARLLRAIYFEPELAPDFLPSLAVAGIDGTIRNRFHGTPAVGLVRAKTGTLSGVSALSGYVGDKADVIVFSILVEGFRGKRTPAVRHAQVRLVDAMLRYLRADAQAEPLHPRPGELQDGAPPPPTPIGEEEEEPIDSEADGDPAP